MYQAEKEKKPANKGKPCTNPPWDKPCTQNYWGGGKVLVTSHLILHTTSQKAPEERKGKAGTMQGRKKKQAREKRNGGHRPKKPGNDILTGEKRKRPQEGEEGNDLALKKGDKGLQGSLKNESKPVLK